MKESSKQFGLISIILLGVNSILGTGIFFLPSQAMSLVGPSSLCVYLFVSFAATIIAFCFAECASLFTRSGGAYVYAKEAFGDFVGFEVGMMRWVSSILSSAALAVGFIMTLEQLIPEIETPLIHNTILILLIFTLAAMNIIGVSIVKVINNASAIAKILPLILFIAFGSFYVRGDHFAPFVPEHASFGDFGSTAIAIFFAFSGFESLAVASAEMENPKKNLPIAIFVILFLTSTIYFLVHTVLIGVLGPGLATTKVPIALAAEVILGDGGRLGVLVCMLIASLGTNIAGSFIAPRVAVALADDSMLPFFIGRLGKFETPSVAIAITAFLTVAVALSGSFTVLATISVVMRFVQYFPTCLAVLVFRRRPDLQSSFPRVLGPFIPIAALTIIIWMALNASFEALAIGIFCMIAVIPLYFLRGFTPQRRHILN